MSSAGVVHTNMQAYSNKSATELREQRLNDWMKRTNATDSDGKKRIPNVCKRRRNNYTRNTHSK